MTAKADTNPLREARALLDKHVDCVRHYLHMQHGKPLSKALISAPEIALDNLHREMTAALASEPVAGTVGPVAWMVIRGGSEGTYTGLYTSESEATVWLDAWARDYAHGAQIQPLYAAVVSNDGDPEIPDGEWPNVDYEEPQSIYDRRRALSAPPAPAGREAKLAAEVKRLRDGLQSIVDLKNPLPRAAVREACAEILAGGPTVPPHGEAASTGDQDFVDMLWKWFEDRGCDLRSERAHGLTANEFRIMLDEHEAALIPTPPAPGAADRAAVIEECLSCEPQFEEDPIGDNYQRGRTGGIKEYSDYIRALAPANAGETGK